MANIAVARDATNEVAPWIVGLARAGFVAKAALYGTIGAFAALAGLRIGGGSTDTGGAMSALVDAPFGRVLMALMAVGLAGYAAWRIIEGLMDPERRGTGVKALGIRSSFVVRGLAHGLLALSAARLALGSGDRTGGGAAAEQGREATEMAFEVPGGSALVWAIAIGIAGYGVYQLYRAFASKLGKRLNVGEMSRQAGRWVIGVSRFGIAARGIVFIAIGWLASLAARSQNANRTGGIREALEVIRQFGTWPFLAVAFGLIAYGVFQLLNARYRRIQVSDDRSSRTR